MRLYTLIILVALAFIGCNKSSDVNPGSKSVGSAISTTPLTSTVPSTHDDSIHVVSFIATPQMVISSVSDTILTLTFNENVNLLLTAAGYQQTSAVHLLENFKSTLLAGFDFTTVDEQGNTTLNWVDDNLNNVILKTITDTVINKVQMVKINVHRPFTFFKLYGSNQAALAEQAVIGKKLNDNIVFSSYCYYNQKNYAPDSTSTTLVYSK
jgi:hypothetical protein